MKYELANLEEYEFETDDFENEIKLGDFRYYYVLCDNKPYLKVEVDLKEAFDDAVIYNNHLLIGSSDKVYFINLSNLQITESEVEMYFGYFILRKEAVYILDGTGIMAFNERLEEIWRNHRLAIDGVTFREMIDDEIMMVSCEMDPPGGWVDRKINIKNGEVVG
jgi:hypothetical protein